MQLSDNERKTPLNYAKELENGENLLVIYVFEWSQLGGTDV